MMETNLKSKVKDGSFRLARLRPGAGIYFFLFWIGMAAALQAEARFSGPYMASGCGVRIDLIQLLDHPAEYGFVPVEITIRNDSGKTRSWNFNFTSGGGYGDELSLEQVHSIEVGEGKTKTVALLVPLPGTRNNQRAGRLQVSVTGFGVSRPQAEAQSNWVNNPSSNVGLSKALYTNLNGSIGEALKKQPSHESGDPSGFFAQRKRVSSGSNRDISSSPLDFSRLPADWRGYSGLSGMVMSDQEWKDLPKTQVQAVEDWMAAGGHLILTHNGSGKTDTPVGFGVKMEIGVPDSPADSLAEQILALDFNPGIPWSADFLQGWGLKAEVGPLRINTWLIIGFVVVFGIVVAPLNLFVFAPPRYRHRLFWTVPLISVVASVLLVLLIIFQEGFGGKGVRLAAVLLLPEEHKMVVIQEEIVKTALLLGQEFPLSEKAVFSEVALTNGATLDGTVTRQGDKANGDWFSSRTVRGFQLKTILPTRSRIEIAGRSPEGAPMVLSSLPVNLKNFNLVDRDGKIWSAAELKTGERQTLQNKANTLEESRKLLESRASANLKEMVAPILRRPGTFVAEAEAGGGLPIETLGSVSWKDDHVIYLGTWTEEGL